MSVPRSKVIPCGIREVAGRGIEKQYPQIENLSVSKGLMALTDVKTASPTTTQNVYVNVNSKPKDEEKGATRNAVVDGQELSDVVIVNPNEPNPYANTGEGTSCPTLRGNDIASMDDVRNQFNQLQQVIKEKTNLAMALSIMLNLVENNPLIINKYIVASRECLTELLKLLTDADEITFNESYADVGCSCNSVEYSLIDKIYVIKNCQTYVLKYTFPDVVKILDDHKISLKMCCN